MFRESGGPPDAIVIGESHSVARTGTDPSSFFPSIVYKSWMTHGPRHESSECSQERKLGLDVIQVRRVGSGRRLRGPFAPPVSNDPEWGLNSKSF